MTKELARATSVRLRGALEAEVDARVDEGRGRPTVVARDLARYYALLQRSMPRWITENVALLVCDALNGALYESPAFNPAAWLQAEIEDAIRLNELDAKWEVNGNQLGADLESLSPTQALAVIDAVERFWSGPHEQEDARTAVREVFGIKG